jgi:hypothetical protein
MAIFSLTGYSSGCGDVPTKRQTSAATSTSPQAGCRDAMYSVRNTQSEGNLQVLQRLFSAENHRKITKKAEKENFFCGKRRKAA